MHIGSLASPRWCAPALWLGLAWLSSACGDGGRTSALDEGASEDSGDTGRGAAGGGVISRGGNTQGSERVSDPAPGSDVTDLPAAWVFDDSVVRSYEVTLPASVWANLKRNAQDEQYAEAELRVGDISLSNVGLRFKGSLGTLAGCFRDDGSQYCSKLSMKLKFDEYVQDQRLFGLKRLNLNSMILDPSSLRERLAYRLFREMGVAAPRAVHARLLVNGELIGLFSLVEEVDGRFTDDRFAGGDGNLYKEAWPDTADATFLGEHLETNEELADHRVLQQFHQELVAAAEAEQPAVAARYLDLDSAYAYFAVDQTISDWDGVTTFYCYEEDDECENHNYFLYQHEREPLFTLIPWDLDNTFERVTPLDGIPGLFERPRDCSMRYDALDKQVMPPGCDPLLHGIAADRSRYLAALDRLLQGPFRAASVETWLERWQAQLEPVIAEDGNGPGTEDFRLELGILRDNISTLRERATEERARGL